MIVNIIGQHPIPQPGLDGVMSLYEAVWFSKLGDDVVLYIPFSSQARLDEFKGTKTDDLDDLEKLGGDFRIEPLLYDGAALRPADVTVWQSRSREEWISLHQMAATRSRVVTKSFPKVVPQGLGRLHRDVAAQLSEFDFVALALREDLDALQARRSFYANWSHRLGYVPRGADPVLLHPGYKAGRKPVVAIDTPDSGDLRAIEHYYDPLQRLKSEFPDLEVMTLGRSSGLAWATTIPFGRFDEIYDQFFNRAWLYLTIDFRLSPLHLREAIHQLDPLNWAGRATYELQNIEAQMSGAVVVGNSANLIAEQFELGESAVYFADSDDADEVFDRIAGVIDGYDNHRSAARAWALRNHNWESCIATWRASVADLALNSYERNSGATISIPVTVAPVATMPKVGDSDNSPRLRMSPGERSFFLHCLQSARVFVEYGSGGSTVAAVQSPVEHIYSVESDVAWLDELANSPDVAVALKERRLTTVHVDLGRTSVWGYPESDEKRADWPGYAERVWQQHVSLPVDLVLIDGRFRTYSAAVSLRRISQHGLVLIHDFWDRPHYHEILRIADVVDRVETFVALRLKPECTGVDEARLDQFRFDPR